MDLNNNPGNLPPSSVPPGMPPGMFLDAQAELDKANWAFGLGIASFFFCCTTAIPALIIGWPLMKRAEHPEAKSRAKLGVIFSLICMGLALLGGLVYAIILTVVATAAGSALGTVPYLESLNQELRQIEKHAGAPEDAHFDVDDDA